MTRGEYGYDLVVSIDLGWSPRSITRTAAAFWRPGQDPWWTEPGSAVDILGLLSPYREEHALILLDIPIHGTEALGRERPFRPLDRVLISCGIPLYPSYRAGSLGRELAAAIEGMSGAFEVVESYPNPVHRFLWHAKDEPKCLEGELRALEGTEAWRKAWPPRYKRGSLAERRENTARLIGVLERFLPGDYSSLLPEPGCGGRRLDAIGDAYDALVALRVGMEMARSSPWVLEARVEGHEGMIPLLADLNMRELWEISLRKYLAHAEAS